jgi:hypothetical protein
MAFTGNENQNISLMEAIELTTRYRESVGPASNLAGFFGKTILEKILGQPGCVGIRIYHGLKKEDNSQTFVLVGADSNEKDLYNGDLAEYATPCPPFCDSNSPLHS